MSGARHRQKGTRLEREIVARHKALGIHAERYPLSGASHFRGSGHDVDVYALGENQPPLVAEVKARATGAGFAVLEKWLGNSERVPGTRLVQEQHPLVTTHGRPARCDARHWLRIAAMRTLTNRAALCDEIIGSFITQGNQDCLARQVDRLRLRKWRHRPQQDRTRERCRL
jgi:hypothetical protein